MFTAVEPLLCKSLYYPATLVWPEHTLVTSRLKSYATASLLRWFFVVIIVVVVVVVVLEQSNGSVFCIMAHPEANTAHTVTTPRISVEGAVT